VFVCLLVRGGYLDPKPSARRVFGPSAKCAEALWTSNRGRGGDLTPPHPYKGSCNEIMAFFVTDDAFFDPFL